TPIEPVEPRFRRIQGDLCNFFPDLGDSYKMWDLVRGASTTLDTECVPPDRQREDTDAKRVERTQDFTRSSQFGLRRPISPRKIPSNEQPRCQNGGKPGGTRTNQVPKWRKGKKSAKRTREPKWQKNPGFGPSVFNNTTAARCSIHPRRPGRCRTE